MTAKEYINKLMDTFHEKRHEEYCDVCGKSVYQHAKHQYQIRKRFWEKDRMWKMIDLCEDCWIDIQNTILSCRAEE